MTAPKIRWEGVAQLLHIVIGRRPCPDAVNGGERLLSVTACGLQGVPTIAAQGHCTTCTTLEPTINKRRPRIPLQVRRREGDSVSTDTTIAAAQGSVRSR